MNSSNPTNALATVSSATSDLYCLSDRSQISVYSASEMASLRNAFSSSSRVTMMLKISARESWRSRSARLSVSLTSWRRWCQCPGLFGERGILVKRTSSKFIVADRELLGT